MSDAKPAVASYTLQSPASLLYLTMPCNPAITYQVPQSNYNPLRPSSTAVVAHSGTCSWQGSVKLLLRRAPDGKASEANAVDAGHETEDSRPGGAGIEQQTCTNPVQCSATLGSTLSK